MLGDIYTFFTDGHLGEAMRGTAIAFGGFIVLCILIWVVSGLWWRRLGFKLDDEEISIRRGVLSKSLRSARYDRTQAVDVVENLIARIFGLASVRVETAGGTSSVIEVAYLKKAEAEALRLEVLAHVHGVVDGRAEPEEAIAALAEEEGVAPDEAKSGVTGTTGMQRTAVLGAEKQHPEIVPEIPIRRSLAAAALRFTTILTLAFIIVIIVTPVPLSTVIPILVGIVPGVWGLLDSSWRFNAQVNEEENTLNIAYGLADRRRQSIRIERIHGVRVTQPLLWRMLGWYEVNVSVAGYGRASGGAQSGSTRILPVGNRELAMKLFERVSDLSAEQIETYAQPEGFNNAEFTSPKRAFWSSPLDHNKQAVTLIDDDAIAITHAGRINRRVTAVTASHVQELTFKAGPIRQALGLGTVAFEMVAGPATLAGEDLEYPDCIALMDRLRARKLPAMASASQPTIAEVEESYGEVSEEED
ncbi:PH domain-containing protein [Corynebacterium sp. L4756]|uniref:PH domain-containing protein n=1 Tax=unclassified Corynebacterium TaxID=2624378 RepID=UPI00374DB595